MCGIAGIVRFKDNEIEKAEIKALTDAIEHRGPDGEGCWIHENKKIGLGHRRLSIIDLTEKGAQPMHYNGGAYTLTFNGEIFNFLEIREELITKGFYFNSDSDSEVLLAAYQYWGNDCLYKFNGFWAFAIWDEIKQELFLARDRYGIKPLYFLHQYEKQFIFASETNQFKCINNFERVPDENLVALVMQNSWGIEGTGKTIFKNIEQVKPGHFIILNVKGDLKIKQWWKTEEHLVEVPKNYEEQVEQFKHLFEDAIKLRLRSDVSIASALSGGLDSSAVYSTIHHLVSTSKNIYRIPKNWQKAFVAVFPGTAQDERKYAEEVVQYTGGNASYIDMNDGHLASKLIKSVKQYDAIYATPLFILDGVYGAMRNNGITVSMDGHGVDEMLYGYPTNVFQALQNEKENGNVDYAIDIENTFTNMVSATESNRLMGRNSNTKKDFINRQLDKVKSKFKTVSTNETWLNNHLLKGVEIEMPDVPSNFKGSEAQLYSTFHHTVLPTILRNFDRGAMQNSIEIRMPFLDYRLVSYIFSLPKESKVGNGFTKKILRDAMKGILPENVRTRKLKIGFNAPLNNWYNGQLKEMILDETASSSFLQNNYWNGKLVHDFVLQKSKNNNWTEEESFRFWPILNAHLLLKN
jgi:asparagine synthase (glutamine-hydrolysing)